MLFRRFASSLPPNIRQLLANPPDANLPIQVNGWIKSIRRQKNVSFAVINDGSSTPGLQAVFANSHLSKTLTNGASVQITGRLTKSLGSGQHKELQVDGVVVLGECDPDTYPIQKQALSVEYLRDNAHLRARTDTVAAMLRLRDFSLKALHKYFEDQGFCYAHPPIITSNDCEGAGEAFRIAPISMPATQEHPNDREVEFFTMPSFLTVSSQLHLEALSSSISRVFTISPCFRAEKSQTSRHLAEFWMLEAEWAFTQHVSEVCQVVEDSIKAVMRDEASASEIAFLWKGRDSKNRLANVFQDQKWASISYTRAISELQNYQTSLKRFQFEPVWGKPLQSEHERWLAEELVGGPVFVTDYPATMKPFYMRLNDDKKTVACFDLLMPHIGEVVGGSLREERLPLLKNSLEKHGLSVDEYRWYLELRRYGGAPHGGFGMGFERLISFLSGIENVRECIPMPRWAGRMLL